MNKHNKQSEETTELTLHGGVAEMSLEANMLASYPWLILSSNFFSQALFALIAIN